MRWSKYVLPEEDSPVVEKLIAFHHAGMTNLIAPAYVLVESANVIWKHIQRRDVRPEDAVPSLRAIRDLGIRLVPDADLLEDALILAADNGITVYDALFCALAARENVQLITNVASAEYQAHSTPPARDDPGLSDLAAWHSQPRTRFSTGPRKTR